MPVPQPPAVDQGRLTVAFGYPVALELRGRRAVVIGEEAVAQGKADGLLAAGAAVTVVATGPAAALARLEAGAAVLRRGWRPADLDGAALCVAASPDPAERAAIAAAARERGVLVNVMDDVACCDFAAPAVVRRGELLIAISTGGRSPALARRLRVELADRYGPEWAEVVELLGRVRAATLPYLPDLAERARRWQDALDLEELAALVREGRSELAAERLRARLLPEVADAAGPP
jgi:siroheme synthase-like protein